MKKIVQTPIVDCLYLALAVTCIVAVIEVKVNVSSNWHNERIHRMYEFSVSRQNAKYTANSFPGHIALAHNLPWTFLRQRHDSCAFVFIEFCAFKERRFKHLIFRWKIDVSKSTMSDRDLAKEIISAGQKKEFSRLEEIVSGCDTKLVKRSGLCSRNRTSFNFRFVSVGENSRRTCWSGRLHYFLEFFA